MSKKVTFGSYFTLNTSSIQGRVTMGFTLTVLFAIITTYTTDYFWQRIISQKNQIISDIQPLSLHSIRLLNQVKQTETNLNQFLYLTDETYQKANEKIWLIDIKRRKDTILSHINKISNTDIREEAKVHFTTLNRQLSDFKKQQGNIINIHTTNTNKLILKYHIKNDLSPTLEEIEKAINELINIESQQTLEIEEKIQSQIAWFHTWLIIAIVIGVILCYSFGISFFRGIFKWVREVRNPLVSLAQGNIPQSISERKNEFRSISKYTNILIDKMKSLIVFTEKTGKFDFHYQDMIFDSNSDLETSLKDMSSNLNNLYDTENKRNWVTEGLTRFAEIQRLSINNLDKFCKEILSNLVEHLELTQAGFFLITQKDGKSIFELKGAFAYNKEKFIQKEIDINDGLLGRVYVEKEIIIIKDVPEGYIEINSAFGSTTPNILVVLPLKNNEGEIKGAIELTSQEDIPEYKIDFLEKLSLSIAITLTNVLASQANQELLKKAKINAQKLRKQEAETKESAHELKKAQNKIEYQLDIIQKENEQINAILNSTLEAIIITDSVGKIEVYNQGAANLFEYTREEIIGKNIKVLMPYKHSLEHEQYMTNYVSTKEKKVIGQKRPVEARSKSGKTFPVYISLTEFQTKEARYFTGVISTIL